VGSEDDNLYAINPDGSQKWAFATGNKVDSSPAIAPDGTVYIGSSDDRLYAIDGNSGGLASSPWPMFHFDVKHTANVAKASRRAEIIGTWSNGIWYWDVAAAKWTQMTADSTTGDIAAGDFTGDGKADVASIWASGLWYQDGATLAWTKVGSAPDRLTAGDVTGDGRSEIIGTWSNGIWYWDVAAAKWTQMTADSTTGDIAAGDFTGDGKADVASIWPSGLWYQDGATLAWTKVTGSAPVSLTAGDVTGQ
jgi:hypothetical protein